MSQLSRNRKLPIADTIRLLIDAEGGSLDKILHVASIEATAARRQLVAGEDRPENLAGRVPALQCELRGHGDFLRLSHFSGGRHSNQPSP